MSSREFRRPPQNKKPPACVPRRFSIGTLLVFATLYSLLFAMLGCFHAPPAVFLVITVFLTGVGAAQMLLFGGKKPRTASVVAGLILWPLIAACIAAHNAHQMRTELGFIPYGRSMEEVIGSAICWGIFCGPVLGYVGGMIVSFIFLFLTRDQKAMEADAEYLAEYSAPLNDEKPSEGGEADA